MSQDAAADQQPATGLTEVDQALAGLADLEQRPVAEHPEALAAVHEVLHQALHAPTAQASPGQASPGTIPRPAPRPAGS